MKLLVLRVLTVAEVKCPQITAEQQKLATSHPKLTPEGEALESLCSLPCRLRQLDNWIKASIVGSKELF